MDLLILLGIIFLVYWSFGAMAVELWRVIFNKPKKPKRQKARNRPGP